MECKDLQFNEEGTYCLVAMSLWQAGPALPKLVDHFREAHIDLNPQTNLNFIEAVVK